MTTAHLKLYDGASNAIFTLQLALTNPPPPKVWICTCIPYGMHKKNDTDIWNVFPKFVCCAACTANQKASSANWKASSKKRKVSSEDMEGFFRRALGLYTLKFLNAVQLCLQIFQSCVCVFRAAFVMAKQNSNEKVSANVCHF